MSHSIAGNNLLSLPLGDSNFTKLRENGKIYVDKTALVYELAKSEKLAFLVRPRRFGKSLLVSTFYSLFKYGLRDFAGLEIEKLWKDSGKYSVIHLDFSEEKNFLDGADFAKKFNTYLVRYLRFHQLRNCNSLFLNGIQEFAEWLDGQADKSVVLLVDEYDSPLTACLNDPKTFLEVRAVLASFFRELKERTRVFRFLFATGITKFGNYELFNVFEGLQDITLEPDYGKLVGFSMEEVERNFSVYINQASSLLGMDINIILQELEANYNGFCFERTGTKKLLAPWSVLNFFDSPRRGFRPYWFESGGHPSLLLQYVKENSLMGPLESAKKRSITILELSAIVPTKEIDETVLLVQTGYLTIKESRNNVLYLGYPNREVDYSIASFLLSRRLKDKSLAQIKAMDLPRILAQGKVAEFVAILNTAFLALNHDQYPVTNEKRCVEDLLLILQASGMQATLEPHSALERTYIEFTVSQTHWVLELKFMKAKQEGSKLLNEALKLLKAQSHGMATQGKKLILLAMVFTEQERCFVNYAVAETA